MDILTEVRDTEMKILQSIQFFQQTTEKEVNQRDNEDNSRQVVNGTISV